MLIIRGGAPHTKGLTKYYEYGRYDKAEMGRTRKISIPDVVLGTDGRATRKSLEKVLAKISHKAGHGTRIQGSYIEVPGQFDNMLKYVTTRMSANKNSKRDAYSIWTNSCLHFMTRTAEAGGVDMPMFVDPSPSSVAEEIQDAFADLDYDPKKGVLKIEPAGKVPEWAKQK